MPAVAEVVAADGALLEQLQHAQKSKLIKPFF
jgi:hypothetical protein